MSLYIALLSCAREGIRVKERITVCLPSGKIKNRFLLIDDSITGDEDNLGEPHYNCSSRIVIFDGRRMVKQSQFMFSSQHHVRWLPF